MKILKWLVLGLVLAMAVNAVDFPGPFEGKSSLVIVVGDNAPAEDVISATDVANAFGPSIALKNTKLASEIDDISKYNSVLIGSPCYHPIINQLVGYPENCRASGIKLIKHSNGNIALLIMGSTPAEIRQNVKDWVSTKEQPPVASPGAWKVDLGGSVTYGLNGVEYEVKFSDFSNNVATFWVNGETIRLPPQTKQELAGGSMFVLADVKENTAWFFMLANSACTDSDGGKNIFVRGTAYGSAPFVSSRDYNGEPVLKTDFCEKDRYDCKGDCLVEYYCESSKYMGYYATECSSGCRDGACIREVETYDSCISEYEAKAREYETWRQNYPEGKRVREEGLRVCGDKFGRPVPPETPSEMIQTEDYKKCMEKLNEFKQELVDKYTLRNIPIPDDVMKDYEERSAGCLRLAGWTTPEPTTVPTPAVEAVEEKPCVGCRREKMCLQFGIRLVDESNKPVYCDFDGIFKPQKQLGEVCQNNYECISNTCSEKCISVTERIEAVEKELKEQRGLIEKILDFFKRLF